MLDGDSCDLGVLLVDLCAIVVQQLATRRQLRAALLIVFIRCQSKVLYVIGQGIDNG